MTICSQYLRNVDVPIPVVRNMKLRKHRINDKIEIPLPIIEQMGRLEMIWVPVFKLFPIIITILLMWLLCVILTVTDAIDETNGARTDKNIQLLYKADWFRLPYPCKTLTCLQSVH